MKKYKVLLYGRKFSFHFNILGKAWRCVCVRSEAFCTWPIPWNQEWSNNDRQIDRWTFHFKYELAYNVTEPVILINGQFSGKTMLLNIFKIYFISFSFQCQKSIYKMSLYYLQFFRSVWIKHILSHWWSSPWTAMMHVFVRYALQRTQLQKVIWQQPQSLTSPLILEAMRAFSRKTIHAENASIINPWPASPNITANKNGNVVVVYKAVVKRK